MPSDTKPGQSGAHSDVTAHGAAPAAASDYFAVLGVERSWHLDPTRLAARHLALSRELHPDRFAQASPRERILSLERTTALNDAYRTLRDPIRRAEYILRQAGIGHSDHALAHGHETNGVELEFLEKIMHWRERMHELGIAGGRGGEHPEALTMRAAAAAAIADLDRQIDAGFTVWEHDPDGPGSRPALLGVERCLAERRYYVNILREIDGEDVPAGHGTL